LNTSDLGEEERHISLRNRATSKVLGGGVPTSSTSGTRSEDRLTTSTIPSKFSEKSGNRATNKNSHLMLIESNKDSKVSLNSKTPSSYTVTSSSIIKNQNGSARN
jgi:hypothetical protein